ncbi:1023_t:CDS:2, partial [Acaulospora colombiana]
NDGQILLFGCSEIPNVTIMDIKNNYTWISPSVSNQDIVPENLIAYTANLIENYVLIAFGFLYTNITTDTGSPSSNIYLLDISQRNNFSWVNSFIPIVTSPPVGKKDTSVIIGVSAGV